MGVTQLSPGELYKTIANASPEDIKRQMELFESNYPFLISFAKHLRAINSAVSKMDFRNQNAELVNALNYLCEHNYLLFLTITGNFALIRELYDPFFSDKERNIVAFIKKEYVKTSQEQPNLLEPLKLKSSATEPAKSSALWEPFVFAVTPMDLFYQYDALAKKAALEYKHKQVLIYIEALDQRLRRLQKTIEVIKNDQTLSSDEKRTLLEPLEAQLAQEKEELEILKRQIEKNPGDLETSRELHASAEALYLKGLDWLESNRHHSPHLEKIYQEEMNASLQVTAQLKMAEEEYNEKMSELLPHLQAAREASQEKISKSLEQLIQIAEACPKEKLTAEQRQTLNDSLERLEHYKEQITTAQDYDSVQGLLQQCITEMETVESIVGAVLPKEAAAIIDQEIDALSRMVIEPKGKSSESKLVMKTSIISEPNLTLDNEPKEHVLSTQLDTPHSNLEQVPQEPQHGEMLNSAHMFRSAMQNTREEGSGISDADEIMVLSDEMALFWQNELEAGLNEVLTELKENNLIENQDLSVFAAIDNLRESLSTSIEEKRGVSPDQMRSLHEKLATIKSHYAGLEQSTEQLNSVIDSLSHDVQITTRMAR